MKKSITHPSNQLAFSRKAIQSTREEAIPSLTYIQQRHLWVVFSNHEQREVASAIEQTQGCRDLTPGEAVQGQMSLTHNQKYCFPGYD